MAHRKSSKYRSTTRSRKLAWPEAQIIFWDIVVLAAAGTILGVSSKFLEMQSRMLLGVPWLFPYGVTIGVLTIVVVLIQIVLLRYSSLQPGLMMIFSFILFVLFVAGLIGTAIQLFGPSGANNNCQVNNNNNTAYGTSVITLAWLEQSDNCSCWYAAFSFWLIGCIFFIWMFFMAIQVGSGMSY